MKNPWEEEGGSGQQPEGEPQWVKGAEGGIPVDPGSLPIDSMLLDESLVYNARLKRVTVSPKLSKGGLIYCAVGVEVADGDFEGANLQMNYMALPYVLPQNATKAQAFKSHNDAAQFGRFALCYGFKGVMPTPRLEQQAIAVLQDWFSQFYGNIGKVTVKNDEFPQGSGRLRSILNDFVVTR